MPWLRAEHFRGGEKPLRGELFAFCGFAGARQLVDFCSRVRERVGESEDCAGGAPTSSASYSAEAEPTRVLNSRGAEAMVAARASTLPELSLMPMMFL